MSKKSHIDPTLPARLVPIEIAKPWGKEIWYTGMEVRGESRVEIPGESVSLSSYLASDPARMANHESVLLLKVLDPKPVEVLGDMYFEVHEEKQEVYVVTHVDRNAWPAGVGAVRFGMNQVKRAEFKDAHAFRAGYLQAVKSYEKIRRQIDQDLNSVAAQVEKSARQHMNSFAHTRELHVGDVVKVPTWTPHSLMHGVRVVEFQTPTYERYIISFAQQVLTQDHWDSQHAIANMRIDTPTTEVFEAVSNGIEKIVSFTDFSVWRVNLSTREKLVLSPTLPYAVCMGLDGDVQVGALPIAAEQACFIPHAALAHTKIHGTGRLLIAAPNL